jgi:hypothetical protein
VKVYPVAVGVGRVTGVPRLNVVFAEVVETDPTLVL